MSVNMKATGVARNLTGIALMFLMIVGCGGEPRGGPRVKVVPANGTVTVDGEATDFVVLSFHPEKPHVIPEGGTAVSSNARTDTDGKYVVSTYEKGDGLPPGNYQITARWLQPAGLSLRGVGGPDKLNGRYEDPETSGLTLTVGEDDSEVQIPVLALETDGEVPEE